jgi:hypothetical protein
VPGSGLVAWLSFPARASSRRRAEWSIQRQSKSSQRKKLNVATHREPLFFHRLPEAPNFVGREAELEALRAAWQGRLCGVLALVGLGGSGKMALTVRFLEEVVRPEHAPSASLFVWSFYQEPDAGLFLQELYRYLAPGASATPAKGAGLLHLLREHLGAGARHLLVLDGLERVQRQDSAGGGTYGQLEDPLLKGLLTRVAESLGQTAVVVTSRFPLSDLAPFEGRGYRSLEVEGLDLAAAMKLLRSRGVRGGDDVLAELVGTYGAHALTLDHLGGLIGQFLGGDPRRAPELPALSAPGTDRQALRLARLLRAYEEHLPPAELALLTRLCLLRRSLSEEQVVELFLCSPPVHARTLREIGDSFRGPHEHLPASFVRELAASVVATLEESLCSAVLAGPEEGFRAEMRQAAEALAARRDRSLQRDTYAEVAGLYAGHADDSPSDARPLSTAERDGLAVLYTRFRELLGHPLKPWKLPKPSEGLLQMKEKLKAESISHGEALNALVAVQERLDCLVAKHFTLRRVRETCRMRQQKWTLAGDLAPLDRAGLVRVLDDLCRRHLVLRESDGSFSVHPAVRDHFSRLAGGPGSGAWHDVIRGHLITLARRPGKRLPDDAASLDLIEEAIYHAQQAGRREEAVALYRDGLGGLHHLAWKLGETARGLRILRSFNPCPDRWALGWHLRALGEYEEAYAQNDLPYFRADIRLLQGRLPEVIALGDDVRAAAARFLMGQTTQLPPDILGCAIPREQMLIYLGRLQHARRSMVLDGLYQHLGWEGDRARAQVLAAEAAWRQGYSEQYQKYLVAASPWILRSGSVEHLCLFHLVRARAERRGGRFAAAQQALDEGLHVARQCGLGLYHIELLCEQAEVLLATGLWTGLAEQSACEALERAADPCCQFAWGKASAEELRWRCKHQSAENELAARQTSRPTAGVGESGKRAEWTPRWLFDSQGRPIAFVHGCGVTSRRGRLAGNLFGSELRRDQTYCGEIVAGNRLLFRQVRGSPAPLHDKSGVPNQWEHLLPTPPAPIEPISVDGFTDVRLDPDESH